MKRYNDQTYIQAKSATESVGGELGVYTKAEIDNIISGIESGGADLTNYYTKSQVDTLISNIPSGSADLSNYYTKSQIDNKGYITSVPSEYITETELASYNFLTTHQDLSNYATQSWVNSQIANAEIGGGGGSTIDFTNYVQFTDTFNATKNGVVPKPTNAQYSNSDYYLAANGTWVDIEDKINYYSSSFSGDYNDLSNTPDLSVYATESYVDNAIPDTSNFLTSSDLSGYATETYVDNAIPDTSNFLTSSDLSGYATESYVDAEIAKISGGSTPSNLADVAYSGDFSDLTGVPDYVTQSEMQTAFSEYSDSLNGMYTDQSQVSSMISSALSSYATESYVDNALHTDVSTFNNDAGYVASSDLAAVAFSGDYDDLTNKPVIPSTLGELTDNVGYCTKSDVETIVNQILSDNNLI